MTGFFNTIASMGKGYHSTPVLLCVNTNNAKKSSKTVKTTTTQKSTKTQATKSHATTPQKPASNVSKKPVAVVKGNDFSSQQYKEIVEKTGLSKDFLTFIVSKETLALERYNDPSTGKPTISVGHTIKDGEGIGKYIDKTIAQKIFTADLKKKIKAVKGIVGHHLNRGQLEALVDLSFNIGEGTLKKSDLIRHIKAKDYNRAAKNFNFVLLKDGDKFANTGLCLRRLEDMRRFFKDVPCSNYIEEMGKIKDMGIKSVDNDIRAMKAKKKYMSKVDYEKKIKNLENKKLIYQRDAQEVIRKARKGIAMSEYNENSLEPYKLELMG